MSDRPRIILAGKLDAATESRLESAADVVRVQASDEDDLLKLVSEADAIVGRTHTPLTARVFEAGKKLRVVGIAGVGLDQVDVLAAQEHGVKVLNRAGAATQAVAELTVLMMLTLERRIDRYGSSYDQGNYQIRNQIRDHEFSTKTIGIIGMGRIGRRVAEIVQRGFGCRVLYNDVVDVGPFDFDCQAVSKDELFTSVDVISLHVPLSVDTRGLVDAEQLSQIPSAAHLINTCRGAVVDTEALVEALRSNQLAAAALDVTDPEPLPVGHALFALDNCVLTPHIASRTSVGMANMFAVADDVLAYLERA